MHNRLKPRPATLGALLLLLLGAGLILYPHVSNWYYAWQFQRTIGAYDQFADVDCDALWAAAQEYNQALAERGSQFSVSEEERAQVAQLLNPLGNGMMGYVDIPKIDVHLPIYQGTEETELQAGAGWWLGTSLPTGGAGTHCVLAAHNGLVKAKMFTDLDQLEMGDTFSLTILDRELTYQVDQILVVEPDDLTPLYIQEGADYVTLYTCTPYGVNSHRLLVRGSRIDPPSTEPGQPFAGRRIAFGLILFVSAAVFFLYLADRCRPHGKREAPKAQIFSKRGNKNGKLQKKRLAAERPGRTAGGDPAVYLRTGGRGQHTDAELSAGQREIRTPPGGRP